MGLSIHNYPLGSNTVIENRKALGKIILCKISCYWHRYRTRKHLALLTEERLKDIGLSQEQALRESQQPFWK